MKEKAYLILADGTIYEGESLGAKGTTVGEVVFTTGMTGYQETLTDPSYYGQIVIQTFPLIGNYGTNDEDFESDGISLSGYVVREWCEKPSNFRCKDNIHEFLKNHNIVSISGLDTRSITRKIREHGVMNAMITNNTQLLQEKLQEIKTFNIINAINNVSTKKFYEAKADNAKYNVGLIDFGAKANIIKMLLKRNCNVTILPSDTNAKKIQTLGFDGLMLSNGPGDPSENTDIIENLKDIINLNIPIFGICLGHQLLALAMGAKTRKMKYGHRGANQPVVDLKHGRTYISTQNHGYAVYDVPDDEGEEYFVNANDKTCEGILYKNHPAFTVQFHPEACAGPTDTAFLFDNFTKLMQDNAAKSGRME